jgi:outer membrane immunogenic protein
MRREGKSFMRGRLFGIVAFTALMITRAAASDLLPPAEPTYSWSGFYVGGSLGGGRDEGDIRNTVPSTFCNPTLGGCFANEASDALAAAILSRLDTESDGFLWGGQIGYNRQFGRFVGGAEADFLKTDIAGRARDTNTQPLAGLPASLTVTGDGRQELDYLGTVRGRLGWTPIAQLLIYGTGGLAYGHVEARTKFAEVFNGPCFCGPFPKSQAKSDEWRAGWTVGGGAEWMFAPRWSLRGQYLYYDLGDVSFRQTILQTNGAGVDTFSADVRSTAEFKGSVVTVGLNFLF